MFADWGKSVSSFIADVTVKAQEKFVQTLEQSKEDFRREEEKLKQIEKLQKQSQSQEAVPLWSVSKQADSNLTGELKQRILMICADEKNLLESPLENQFKFDLHACNKWALLSLEMDPLLQKTRHRLVRPGGVTEEAFWTAYFMHVFRIRENCGAPRLFDPCPPLPTAEEGNIQLEAVAAPQTNKVTPQDEKQFEDELNKFMQEDNDFVQIARDVDDPILEEVQLQNLEDMLADVQINHDPDLEAELNRALESEKRSL